MFRTFRVAKKIKINFFYFLKDFCLDFWLSLWNKIGLLRGWLTGYSNLSHCSFWEVWQKARFLSLAYDNGKPNIYNLWARQAAKDLLGAGSTGEIAFGLNCTNLMFQVARSIENGDTGIKSGDNIVLSRACHDANISPWLLMAKKLNLEVRWLDCLTQGNVYTKVC